MDACPMFPPPNPEISPFTLTTLRIFDIATRDCTIGKSLDSYFGLFNLYGRAITNHSQVNISQLAQLLVQQWVIVFQIVVWTNYMNV